MYIKDVEFRLISIVYKNLLVCCFTYVYDCSKKSVQLVKSQDLKLVIWKKLVALPTYVTCERHFKKGYNGYDP